MSLWSRDQPYQKALSQSYYVVPNLWGPLQDVLRHKKLSVRITVSIIAWASEKDITNVQRMQITRSFRWLELSAKWKYCEIIVRDIRKPFREFKIENSFLWGNAESQHRDIPVGIFSHSLMTKYLVVCGIPLKNNCVAFWMHFQRLSWVQQGKKILSSHTITNSPLQMSNIGKVLFWFQIGGWHRQGWQQQGQGWQK